jgi:hypothetical protein
MSLFLLTVTEQYVAEKRFAKETKAIRLQEYYMLCSIKQAESMMMADRLPATGTIDFKNGTVTFNRTSLSENMEEITFTLKLKSGEKAIGTGRYDKQLGRMVKWIERN